MNLIGRGHDIRVRLFENDQQDSALVVEEAGLLGVFRPVDRIADIAQRHRRAVMLSDDDRQILIGLEELIVARDDEAPFLAVDRAFRRVDVYL